MSVHRLVKSCLTEEGKLYMFVSSLTQTNKKVRSYSCADYPEQFFYVLIVHLHEGGVKCNPLECILQCARLADCGVRLSNFQIIWRVLVTLMACSLIILVQVQIRPWKLGDSDYIMDHMQPIDARKTIFIGGVPRPLKACELADIFNSRYGNVCYAGIDCDPDLKYPKGAVFLYS